MFKKLIYTTILICFVPSLNIHGQIMFNLPGMFEYPDRIENKDRKTLSLDYNTEFDLYSNYKNFDASKQILDNTEFINIARFYPSIAIKYVQDPRTVHKMNFGGTFSKNLGENPMSKTYYGENEDDNELATGKLWKEMTFYYSLQRRVGKSSLWEVNAGIFPASFKDGYYSRALYSEYHDVYDSNMEGAGMRFKSPRFMIEAGFDRIGVMGLDRRVQEAAFASTSFGIWKWFSLGASATYMHVGNAGFFAGDAKNIIANPYVRMDFSKVLPLDNLSLTAGGLFSYNNDKAISGSETTNAGAELVVNLKKWGVGVENTFYYGDNLQTLRSKKFSDKYSQNGYADILYTGDNMYFTRKGYASFCNRTELYYEPVMSQVMNIKLGAVANVIEGTENLDPFIGWQARMSVSVNLDALNDSFQVPDYRYGSKRHHRSISRRDSHLNFKNLFHFDFKKTPKISFKDTPKLNFKKLSELNLKESLRFNFIKKHKDYSAGTKSSL